MACFVDIFVATLLISIGLFSLILGILMVKFASGDTKMTGILTCLIGVIFLFVWAFLTLIAETYAMEIVFWDAIAAVVGALLGAAAAFVLFLLAIMYS